MCSGLGYIFFIWILTYLNHPTADAYGTNLILDRSDIYEMNSQNVDQSIIIIEEYSDTYVRPYIYTAYFYSFIVSSIFVDKMLTTVKS